MACTSCGKEVKGDRQFCSDCAKIHDVPTVAATTASKKSVPTLGSWALVRVLRVLVLLFVIGTGIYSSMDDIAITSNNNGIDAINAGDDDAAAQQFLDAYHSAYTDETKLLALMNLGYVYLGDGSRNEDARTVFTKALEFADPTSADFYLASAEIALLDSAYDTARTDYESAYAADPSDSRPSNSLALFYLDLNDVMPEYVDYPQALIYAQHAYTLDQSDTTKENLALAYYFNDMYDDTIGIMTSLDFAERPYDRFWVIMSYVYKGDAVLARKYLTDAEQAGTVVPQIITDSVQELEAE